MHRKSVAMALFMAALFLIVASQASASTAGDGYVPVDYRLYPAPEGGYVGDTMPYVTEDGTLELYYLYDTDTTARAIIRSTGLPRMISSVTRTTAWRLNTA